MSLGGKAPSSTAQYVPANLPTVNAANGQTQGKTGYNSTILTSAQGQSTAPNTAQKTLLGD